MRLSIRIVARRGHAFVCVSRGEAMSMQPEELWRQGAGPEAARNIVAAGVLSMQHLPLFKDNLDAVLGRVWAFTRPYLLLLPEYRQPPLTGVRFDGFVESFLCAATVLKYLDGVDGRSCFRLLMKCLDGAAGDIRIGVLQTGKPFSTQGEGAVMEKDVSMVIPHYGDVQELIRCLRAVKHQSVQVSRVNVCLDGETDERALHESGGESRVSFWYNDPLHAGPYFPRDHIIRNTASPLVMFQDADDISTYDRVETLLCEMARFPDCGMMGCHELRVDEEEGTVRAIRFPVDVSASLAQTPVHSLYHPTAIISKRAYLACGGFTRWRKFASDYQFLLKAFFFMKIRNVDEFLYIRKKRSHSLTTHALTGLHSKTRKFFDRSWAANFERVKKGEISIEASTLCEDDRHIPFQLRALPVEKLLHGAL